MLTVFLGIFMFSFVILGLVSVLMIARSKLVSAGHVQISINDDPEAGFSAPVGSSLLSTLAQQSIFIPSACGGKGSCGVCKVVVKSGGGALLPTEKGPRHKRRSPRRRPVILSSQSQRRHGHRDPC